jgi:hypothetical protein
MYEMKKLEHRDISKKIYRIEQSTTDNDSKKKVFITHAFYQDDEGKLW